MVLRSASWNWATNSVVVGMQEEQISLGKRPGRTNCLFDAGSAAADLPDSGFMTLSAPTDLAAYGRFRVGANQNATVRIIVCGWSG
jgi:hypothetical protein